MNAIDKMNSDGTIDTLSKRERLQVSRTRAKLEEPWEYSFYESSSSCIVHR